MSVPFLSGSRILCLSLDLGTGVGNAVSVKTQTLQCRRQEKDAENLQ